jgi:ParB/RepB/Spo0J family partition protein
VALTVSRVERALIPLAEIQRSSLNPRQDFDDAALASLGESLREHGLLQPIVVRPLRTGGYEVVAGERRRLAAIAEGWETIAATVIDRLADEDALKLALIENLQREDLNAIEEAEGYANLTNRGMTQKAIAAAVSKAQPTIANALRLLDLPDQVRDYIRKGALSASHGVALARWAKFPGLVTSLADEAIKHAWSSAKLEQKDLLFSVSYQLSTSVAQNLAYGAPPPFSQCEECPFDAYVASGTSGPRLCLNPACYHELKANQDQAEHERREETKAKVKAEGREVLTADEAESATRLWEGRVPSACTDACPCRITMEDRTGAIVPACMDPVRLQELQEKDRLAKVQEAQAKQSALREQVAATKDTSAIGSKEAALIVVSAVRSHRRKHIATAADLVGIEGVTPKGKADDYVTLADDAYIVLARYEPQQIFRFALEVLVADWLEQQLPLSRQKLDWYAGLGAGQ